MVELKPRVEYQRLHLSRILACICVVLLHTLGQLTVPKDTIFSLNWFLQNGIDSFIIWAVPMFVMISGALLLNREYESSLHFYKTRLPRMFTLTFFWFTFYAVADHFTRGDSLSLIEYLKRFVLGPYDHLYFLLIIIGLYLLVPLFSELLTKISDQQHRTLAGLFFFISIFWKLSPFSLTMFIPYIGYFLMGAWLHKAKLPKELIRFSPLIVVFFGVATFLFNLFGHLVLHKETYYFLHHHNPFVIGLSLGVFIFINFHSFFTHLKLSYLKQLAESTLGIYLLHPIVLTLMVINIKDYNWLLAMILLPVIFMICFFLTILLRKIPRSNFFI